MSVIAQIPMLLPSWVRELSTTYLVLASVVGIPVLAIALNIIYQFLPKGKNSPPLVFHIIPWFGSAADYGQDPYAFLFRNRDKYGDLFEFVLLGRRVTVALGPKGNNLSLGGKISQVSAEEAYTHLTTPVFGKGVVYDCPNEMLMQQKKFIKHGLTTEALQSYAPLMTSETEHFFDHELGLSATSSTKSKTVEIFHSMSELIILTASRSLQGKEVRSGLDSKFAKLFWDLDAGFIPVNFMFTNLPLPVNVRRDKAHKQISAFYQNIIQKRRSGEVVSDEHDMITALTGSTYKDGVELTDSDIAHMMIAILMAGQHTSSATSSWTLLHMADSPDYYEQLYQEHIKLFRNADGSWRDVTLEDTKQMPLMDACIRETLRMHAPIHSIYRKVLSPIPVPSSLSAPSETETYIIPRDNFLMAAPGVSSMDPKIWERPQTWNPHRWLDAKGVGAAALENYYGATGEQVDYGFGQISKGTESPYQPFGAGRHRCVGESYAYLQLSVILSYIVRNFHLKMENSEFPKPNYQTMIVIPLKGMVTFTKRQAEV